MMNKKSQENEPSKILAAHALHADPRIAQAKKLLLDAVKEHQEKLTGIRQAQSELKLGYEEMLARFADFRGGKLWFPYLGSGIGNGALVELLDGSVKYDFISGIGPHYWGHSHPDLIGAGIDAALSDTIMQGNLQQNHDSFALCELLAQEANMDCCFLSTSGAIANENAFKITMQKRYPAARILAFTHCFAGRTLALSQVTDKPAYREGLPSILSVDYVPFFDFANPKESTQNAISVLKEHLARYPKQHALMCFELVQGEGGFYPGSKEFFQSLMQILKENAISILVDEIQTFGRTSRLFAFQHFELESYVDIVTLGKLSQVCATLFNKEHKPRPGLLSQTFTGSTSAIRAGKLIIRSLLDEGFFGAEGKIAKIREYFVSHLQRLENRYPHLICGPYGIGAMLAFTLFGGNAQRTVQFVHDLFSAGVMSFTTGSNPTRVRLLIPVAAITFQDIDSVMQIVEATLVKEI